MIRYEPTRVSRISGSFFSGTIRPLCGKAAIASDCLMSSSPPLDHRVTPKPSKLPFSSSPHRRCCHYRRFASAARLLGAAWLHPHAKESLVGFSDRALAARPLHEHCRKSQGAVPCGESAQFGFHHWILGGLCRGARRNRRWGDSRFRDKPICVMERS
jgi:hypothetical protein